MLEIRNTTTTDEAALLPLYQRVAGIADSSFGTPLHVAWFNPEYQKMPQD